MRVQFWSFSAQPPLKTYKYLYLQDLTDLGLLQQVPNVSGS